MPEQANTTEEPKKLSTQQQLNLLTKHLQLAQNGANKIEDALDSLENAKAIAINLVNETKQALQNCIPAELLDDEISTEAIQSAKRGLIRPWQNRLRRQLRPDELVKIATPVAQVMAKMRHLLSKLQDQLIKESGANTNSGSFTLE